MATYTVTTGDVVDPSDGVLSLREALALADADGATADRVEFAPAVQGGTIILAGSQLTVASDVAIDGGAGVTVDAQEASRVLLVQVGTEDQANDVTLEHLTITGGRTTGDYDGGGHPGRIPYHPDAPPGGGDRQQHDGRRRQRRRDLR